MGETPDTGMGSFDDSEVTQAGDDTPVGARASQRAVLSRGDLVGRYVVLSLLGAGGMGAVYAAYDPELDRKIALKLLLPGRGGDPRRARRLLQREAQAMARLTHPNVVAVHDVGAHGDAVYIAMEHVDGPTVSRWLASSRSWTEVLEVFVGAGRGLAAAHGRGLLHRDVKPDNIMLDGRSVAKVTDFGLAVAFEDSERPDESFESRIREMSDEVRSPHVGTPAYMAPEQWLVGHVDARTDQFAYCVALWEALYGERPFDGDTPSDLAMRVTSGTRRPPVTGRGVPGWLRQVVERGLSVEPEARWPSMNALLEALDPERAASRVRSAWVVAALSAVAVLGVAAYRWQPEVAQPCTGAAAQLQGVWDDARRAEVREAITGIGAHYAEAVWERTEQRLDAYAAAWVAGHTDACLATAVRREQSAAVLDLRMGCLRGARQQLGAVTDVLATADADVVQRAHELVAELRPLAACEDIAALQSGVEPPRPEQADAVFEANEQLEQVAALLGAERLEEASEALEDARAIVETNALEYPPLGTRLVLLAGQIDHRRGRHAEAEAELRRALELAAREEQRAAMLLAATGLIRLLGLDLGRAREASQYRELARGLVRTRDEEAAVLNALGTMHYAKSEHADAEALFREMLAIREQASEPDPLGVADALNNVAATLVAQGELAEAVRLYQRSIALSEDALGAEHPSVARGLTNVARAHEQAGRYDEAIELDRRALEIWRAGLGDEHPLVATVLSNLGVLHYAKREFDQAEALHRQALELRKATLGPEHPQVADSLNNLGAALAGRGQLADVEPLYRQSLAIREQSYGAEHPLVAQSVFNLGELLAGQGRGTDARALYERALQIWSSSVAAEHAATAHALQGLAELDLREGSPAAALDKGQRALRIRDMPQARPEELAASRFLVARALAETGREPARAEQLARQALDTWQQAGSPYAGEAARARTWLAEHGAGEAKDEPQ